MTAPEASPLESRVGHYYQMDDTYEVGRYVDPQPVGDGKYILDFNMAYNPACAFSVHYNCPIPPKENALKVAIKAGEKDSHYMHHDVAQE